MFSTISDALLAKFDTMKGAGKPFVAVYDYHTVKTTGYPFLCFEPTEFSAEIFDTCNNKRTYTFTILIFQDINDKKGSGRGEAVDVLTKAMDDVITSLDEDYTLSGTAIQVRPVGGRIEPLTLESGKTMVGSIIVEVETIAFIR